MTFSEQWYIVNYSRMQRPNGLWQVFAASFWLISADIEILLKVFEKFAVEFFVKYMLFCSLRNEKVLEFKNFTLEVHKFWIDSEKYHF